MAITDQDVENLVKLNGVNAFPLDDRCARCGQRWGNHGNMTSSASSALYTQCNIPDPNNFGGWKMAPTTFLPVQSAAQCTTTPANPTGDVMTDQEVEDWVKNNPNGHLMAFDSKEVCTRCGEKWGWHGASGSWDDISCTGKDSTGKRITIPGIFMPTNLPAGFVRTTNVNPCATIPVSITMPSPTVASSGSVPIWSVSASNWALGKDIGDGVIVKQGLANPTKSVKTKEADLADWKAWRDVGRKSDECACGMKREMCWMHK